MARPTWEADAICTGILDSTTKKQEESLVGLKAQLFPPPKKMVKLDHLSGAEQLVSGRVTIPSKLSKHPKSWIFCQGAVNLSIKYG